MRIFVVSALKYFNFAVMSESMATDAAQELAAVVEIVGKRHEDSPHIKGQGGTRGMSYESAAPFPVSRECAAREVKHRGR